MKIAVTDACIFIDLIELQLTSHFFNSGLEIHTTIDVMAELYSEQNEILKAYQSVGKLTVHNLEPIERLEILNESFPKSLSAQDRTVLILAQKNDALILSSDKTLRNYAKSNSIEVHGMIWIFDVLVNNGHLSKNEALSKLEKMIDSNIIYRDNFSLRGELEKRKKNWSVIIRK